MFLDALRGAPSKPDMVTLREQDQKFWDAIVALRPRSEWSSVQLVVAAQLARAQADIEDLQREVDTEGFIIQDRFGADKLNPAVAALEAVTRRQLALMRNLGFAAEGDAEDRAKRESAFKRAKDIQNKAGRSSLLAGSRM